MPKLLKRAIGNKGQGEWSEVLLTVVLSVCIVILAFQVPRIMMDVATLLTIASAEGTARDLAGLITISGAAQDMATITYEGENPTVSYDITIRNRMVTITGLKKDSEEIKNFELPIKTGWGKIAIDPSGDFRNATTFTIKKNRLCTDAKIQNNICDVYAVFKGT